MKMTRAIGIASAVVMMALLGVCTVKAQPNQPPVANAGGPYTGDTSAPVDFIGIDSIDPDGSVDILVWDFGDGSPTVTNVNTSHSYPNTGYYTVTLVVTDNDGASDTSTTRATITDGNQPPTANAGGPYRGTENLPITFNGGGSDDPDGTVLTYAWDFGDGNPGDLEIVEHIYANAGVYNVTLTVTDDGGLTDSEITSVEVVVDNYPPTADAGGPYTGTAETAIIFSGLDSIDPDGVVKILVWDFGDGTAQSIGSTASHTYATDGTYPVTLIVTDNEGATGTNTTSATVGVADHPPVADPGGPYSGIEGRAVSFDAGSSSDEDGSVVGYAWDFGDGNGGSGEKADHIFSTEGSYAVQLTVTDDDGLSHKAGTFAIIGPPANLLPTADAEGPYPGFTGAAVSFFGQGSTDPDGSIDTLVWDFGDGSPQVSRANANHTYTNAGLYIVLLTVTDNDGAKDTDATLAHIHDPNQPPMANPGGPYIGKADSEVEFIGSASEDPDGSITDYTWDFGDGNGGSGEIAIHTYAAQGVYRVSLTVTDDDGLTSTNGTAAVIAENNLPPTANHGGPYSGEPGVPVDFIGLDSMDPDGSVDILVWDFGDGTAQDIGSTASHTYTSAGEFTVVLTVMDDDGATDTSTTTATITTDPTLMIAITAPGEATIDWSPDTAGFILQTAADLGTLNWTDAESGSNHPVTVDPTEGLMFYRLIQP